MSRHARIATAVTEAQNTTKDQEEFPIVCETCLGPNPYVRMLRMTNDRSCKICDRIFTCFRWCPGPNARYKVTEICPACAKAKNVCQTCIFDLQYGLPVQVRDALLKKKDRIELPSSSHGKDFILTNIETQMEENDIHGPLPQYSEQNNLILEAVARRDPYYDRNRAKICTFYIRGACTRGKMCPFRHEMPTVNELANQNIKDRYHGNNDPVATKILDRISDLQNNNKQLQPPDDETICTLFLSNIPDTITNEYLQEHFSQYGEISSLKYLQNKHCAIVTYLYRSSAEEAIVRTNGYVKVDDTLIRVAWTKKREANTNSEISTNNSELPSIPPPEILPKDMHTLRYTSMEPDYVPTTKRPKLPPGL